MSVCDCGCGQRLVWSEVYDMLDATLDIGAEDVILAQEIQDTIDRFLEEREARGH